MTTATVFAVALSVLGFFAPPSNAAPPAGARREPSQVEAKEGPELRGLLVLGPNAAGKVEVIDASGSLVSSVVLRSREIVKLDLPIGTYALKDETGVSLGSVTIAPRTETTVSLPERMRRSSAVTQAVAFPPSDPRAGRPAVRSLPPEPPRSPRPPYKRWLSPLLSAVVPGVGQMVNREAGKGVGILLGSVALLGGSFAMRHWVDPSEGAGGSEDDTRSSAGEITTLALRAGFTGLFTLLYPAQIMDAHRVAAGKLVTPRKDHRVTLELARTTTIGRQVGQPAFELYNDWTFTVMGQPVRRLSVGVSDLGLKFSSASSRTTFQGGVRVTYRFFDRRRLWIAAGLGSFAQFSVAPGRPVPLSWDASRPDPRTDFGGVVYGQLDFRLFFLDRWWIGGIPRFSVPLSTRYYSGQRSLPPFAPTFELGTAAGVSF